jgi:hypothetical protein
VLTPEARAKWQTSKTPAERGAEHSRLLERVPAAQRAGVEKRAAAVPEHHRKLYLRTVAGVASRPEVLKARCLDCCAWQKREVILCTARGCPSWVSRPWRESARETAEAEIRALEAEGLHPSAAVLRALFLRGEPGLPGSAVASADCGKSSEDGEEGPEVEKYPADAPLRPNPLSGGAGR